MRIANLLLVMLAFVCGPHISALKAADGFWLMGRDLGLTGQTNWNDYDGGDAPEGAYMGWLIAGTTNLSGTVPLGRTLPTGTYYVMVKLTDYMGSPGQVEIQLGGGRSTGVAQNSDWNKYWTLPAIIQTTQPTTQVVINLIKTIASTDVQKYLVRGIYITTNANENVPLYGYDRIVDYTYPAVMATSPARKGNLLPDGSFETGLGHGWGFLAEGYERQVPMQGFWVPNSANNTAFHGTACIRIPVKGSLISRIEKVKPNKRYTLSAWVRSPTSTGVGMGIYNVATPPPGFPGVVNLYDSSFRITPNWSRISVSGTLLAYPNSDYQILISANPDTYVDAVQLEEGDASPFRPGADVEIGFQSDKPGRILFEDENPALNVAAFNNSAVAFSGALVFEIYDIYNRKIAGGEKTLSVAPSSRLVYPLTLPVRRGIFRVVAWVKDLPRTLEEVTCAVVPRPRVAGVDESSIIGVHPNLMDFELAMHQRMGIKWGRAMSPEAVFRWAKNEPIEGSITWYDDKVDRAAPAGMSIMGTIGTNSEWPAWADNNGMPNLDKWESFVERLVTHYKGRVKYWEIWNEPIYVFTPEFYAELLKRAGAAIRRADPTAKIVGMGGVYKKDWILQVMNALGTHWQPYLDIISTHLYPPGTDPSGGEAEDRAVAFKNEVIDRYGVEVWNTEAGVWDEGFYKTANSNFSPIGDPMWPHSDSERYVHGCFYEPERLMANFVHCVGNGLTKYFYYDSRIYNNPSYQKSHPTMLEYDDSMRAKGITYAIAAWFLDGSRGLGGMINNATTYAYLFDRGGTATVVVWSKDKLNHSIQLPAADWRIFDMMGNEMPLTNANIPFSRTPVYVQSASLSPDAVRLAFQAATASDRADVLPPNLSLDEFPTGPITDRNMEIRWLGIDETSIPSASNPVAVTYSYQLQGRDVDWSAWTPATHVSLISLFAGNYTFRVRARDAAGNISATVSSSITVWSLLPPAPPGNLRVRKSGSP